MQIHTVFKQNTETRNILFASMKHPVFLIAALKKVLK